MGLFSLPSAEPDNPSPQSQFQDDISGARNCSTRKLNGFFRVVKQNSPYLYQTDIEFLHYILETFPPKHISNYKKPELGGTYAVLRKAFIKLAAYYHPDKVDTSIHGEKHKVLCEEIA